MQRSVKTNAYYNHVTIQAPMIRHINRIAPIPLYASPCLLNIDYTEFLTMLKDNKVLSVELSNDSKIMKVFTESTEVDVDIPKEKSLDLMNKLNKFDIDVDYKQNKDYTELIVSVTFYVITALLIFRVFFGQKMGSFGKSNMSFLRSGI